MLKVEIFNLFQPMDSGSESKSPRKTRKSPRRTKKKSAGPLGLRRSPSELRVFFILPEFVGVRRSPSESGALSNYACHGTSMSARALCGPLPAVLQIPGEMGVYIRPIFCLHTPQKSISENIVSSLPIVAVKYATNGQNCTEIGAQLKFKKKSQTLSSHWMCI